MICQAVVGLRTERSQKAPRFRAGKEAAMEIEMASDGSDGINQRH